MTEALIKELAEQIVNEQIIQNWRLWGVLICVMIVAGGVASFAAAYLVRRAQSLAEAVDRERLIAQLKATTEAAESVRVEISHADWLAKEWKTLRRVKLEEFYSLVYETKEWLERERENRVVSKNKPEISNPMSRLEILSRLYFPALVSEVMAIIVTAGDMKMKVAEAASALASAKAANAVEQHQAALDAFHPSWLALYRKLLEQIADLELKAPTLINEVMGA
ncbi:hypothetical protein [Polaromonas sp. JS666]|uniref:hypothetical protein n=1 Tax=Polaromonas sp. (strain JS666 / ATCC BAA-500) TaxID=296591 RepID=UPI00005344A5|nr:hypothetical protein [Polaromonas sp. JS666]ABE45647.1 hypothetical protein Bpro_3748 [Polaromonas sp. JS666]